MFLPIQTTYILCKNFRFRFCDNKFKSNDVIIIVGGTFRLLRDQGKILLDASIIFRLPIILRFLDKQFIDTTFQNLNLPVSTIISTYNLKTSVKIPLRK